ncbi:MAG: DUF5681 domain-containing protein [Methylococcales bacterium]|nr:DUF5681 domain-containing protein [Methylococcales bacterium]
MSKFEKGTSGNPAGRPSHAVTAAKLRELISADDVQDILTAVITQAKAGDMTAAKLILDKVLPSLKSVDIQADVDIQTQEPREVIFRIVSAESEFDNIAP